MTHVGRVNACRYPAFTEVEVQFIESNLSWNGFLQRFQRVFGNFDERFYAVITGEILDAFFLTVNPCLDVLRFLNHISGDEAVSNLILLHKWIVIDVTFESIKQIPFIFTDNGSGSLVNAEKVCNVVHIDLAVFIERSHKSVLRHLNRCNFIL